MPSVAPSGGSNLFGNGSTKGASAGENSIANSQTNFMNTLQQDFGTAFAGQQNILNGLTKSAQSISAAGPSQFGFSAPELTALNTMATTSNAVGTRNAMTAAGANAAATGGGANLPTGAQGAQNAQIAEQSGQNLSQSLLGIQEAGYNTGRQNYQNANQTLLGVANAENPSGLAGQANQAGSEAFNSANTIQKQNQAASPWAQVGGLVGSLAGAGLNMLAPGAGAGVGALSSIGNFASAGNAALAQNNPMGPGMNMAYGDNSYLIQPDSSYSPSS
jgi:hypothetical protein